MQELQLYIQGQRIDLFKDESVSITQSIQNVKDIAKVFTDFSKTFSIPASKTNNKIFKHYYNFDIVNGFDARIKVDATIELNNLPFKNGKVKLEGVDLKNNAPHTYKITFFGSTVTLKDVLGEDKLQALGDLNSLSLVYDYDNIKTSLQRNPDVFDVITPLITHTQRLFYNSTSSNHQDDNIADTGGSQNIHGVKYSELKYALRVDRIIRAIEANPKYNITFSDDFFVDTNAPYYNLFMWLHRKKGSVQNLDGVNQSLVNGWAPTSFDNGTKTQMINSSTIIVEGEISRYRFFDLYLTKSTGASYRAVIYKDGIEVHTSELTTGNLLIRMSDIQLATSSEYTVYIEADGDIIFTNIYWSISYNRPFSGTENITYNTGTYNYLSVFDFTITQQIPEMKIIDFLTGLFKMFNLTAYVEDDIIQVKTLDSFYNSGTQYDISKYIDVNKSSVNAALPYREISFSYEDTGTFLAKQHTQLAGKEWAKIDYQGEDGNLDGGLYSIKLPFGHLKNELLIDANAPSDPTYTTGIMYGYYTDDNQESYIGKPLLFYPIRQFNGEPISFVRDINTKETLDFYNIPSNSLSLDSGVSKININFNNEKNEYTSANDFTDTLFNVYYQEYIKSVFNKKNRITKLTAYLPLRILLNFKLEDRFIINGNSYKINTITTNLQTGKSDLELLNDL